jgi:hypothetical protein
MTDRAARWTVVITRDHDQDIDVVVLGPFRRRERADARAATVRRLAATYDDDALVHVAVEPLRAGSNSAQNALDYLYGALV